MGANSACLCLPRQPLSPNFPSPTSSVEFLQIVNASTPPPEILFTICVVLLQMPSRSLKPNHFNNRNTAAEQTSWKINGYCVRMYLYISSHLLYVVETPARLNRKQHHLVPPGRYGFAGSVGGNTGDSLLF